MLPSAVVTVLNDAIARAQAYLLPHQAPEGYWVGELEANTTITSEYLLLCHLIDRVDRPKEAKAVRYLRRAQLSDGGWSLFEGGPANLSATIKGYFAMRMAGVSVDDPALVAARERIREMGGPVRADVFTKILLALFGEYDWNGVPAMPVEIMLLPRPFFLFNIYEVSYWSRTVIVSLLIIMDRKPVKWLPPDHPLVLGQIKEIEALAVETDQELHYQPCPSPVWDTALAINALIESGLPPTHAALRRAAEWLIDRQILVPGDWQVKRPHVRPGGWAFQYHNDFYPDLDDTAMVLMALEKVRGLDGDAVRLAKERGLGWFFGMQGEDGGWASFDADNNRLYLNNIPFADHGALLDPSTEDLTGRGLELLGTLGYRSDFEPAQRALHFLRHTQRHDGPWYGRWGVNYIYGTWSVLRGLRAIGEDLRHEYVQRAVRWLERRQNRDGGWGETCESYDDPEFAGVGESTPSQTAWALLGLFAAGRTSGRTVERGIEYLLRTQRSDGSWDDRLWNGTGFPRVFYLKYHLYAKYFPLWALGIYRRAQA